MLATLLILSGFGPISIANSTALAQAKGLNTLYREQQSELKSRYEKNKRYCEALYLQAKYDEIQSEIGMSHVRYYIKNNAVYSIRAEHPNSDGSACQRGYINGVILGRKRISVTKAKDIFLEPEMKSLNIKPEKILGRTEEVIDLEGECIVSYIRDMKTGKIERTPLGAIRGELSRPKVHKVDLSNGKESPAPPAFPAAPCADK